jgi:DNA-binding HxlR family transcriptional regulator
MKIIGAKWAMPIIWYIGQADQIHYVDFKRAVDGITDAMLSMRLKELESCGVVLRESAGTVPPSVTYSLTEKGQVIPPALDALFEWGKKYLA